MTTPAPGTGPARTVFRLHPTINFARVGTSEDFYLSPETSAGLPVPDPTGTDPSGTGPSGTGEADPDRPAVVGGLPIRRGTESEPISSDDLRDADGNLVRQAARFRLFAYDLTTPDRYPDGGGVEILPGSTLPDGRVVAEIVWTVHVANKKSAAFNVVPSEGLNAFADGLVPQLRNSGVYGTVDAPLRLRQLVIDPGPRAIRSGSHDVVACDRTTTPAFSDGAGGITPQPQYPTSFPQDTNSRLFQPSGPLDSLGELRTDDQGRLLVLAGRYTVRSETSSRIFARAFMVFLPRCRWLSRRCCQSRRR